MRSVVFVLFISCLCLAEMDIYYLKEASANEGAVCLDGTPSLYYFKAGSPANSTKWVLHILGGGLCFTDEECYERSLTLLGSSLYWPEKMAYGGPLNENATYNPDFYDWNHAFFAYCDGACFSGDREDPSSFQGHKLYYRGYRIFKATLNDLLQTKGLDKATDVLVVGDSAGGISTFIHIDQIKAMMPKSVTRFKAAPLSGVFLDFPNVEGKFVWRGNMKNVFDLQNCSGGVDQKCLAAQSPDDGYKCMQAEYTMKYTESLLMPIGSAYDIIGTSCIVGGEPSTGPTRTGGGNCSAVPGWAVCEKNSSQCTKDQWKFIEAYGFAFIDRIQKNKKLEQDGNGIFEYNCHSHSIEGSRAWELYSVNGVIMRDAVRAWYFSDNEPSSNHFHTDCINHESYSCNPVCSIPVI